MKTNIAIPTEKRTKINQILNTVLADEHILYTKLRNYHWNVRGIHFVALHELFEQQYNAIKPVADDVAERVRMMGGLAIGTLSAFLEQTRLAEAPSNNLDAEAMLNDLLATNEAMIRNLRDDIAVVLDEGEDEGTADLLIATMRMHEEMAWMLRSLLE